MHSHSVSFEWRECRDHVADALGVKADRWRGGLHEPGPSEARQQRAAIRSAEEQAQTEAARRTLRARALWQQAVHPRETVVVRYLASRGLALPDEVAGEVLRFYLGCLFGEERMPAMVAALRAIESDALQAIHRTALTVEGAKVYRKMLDPAGGAAAKLDSDPDVTTALAIGKKIETGPAARQLGIRLTWALGSVGAIRAVPVLPSIEVLTILCESDKDGANEAAARGGTRPSGA